MGRGGRPPPQKKIIIKFIPSLFSREQIYYLRLRSDNNVLGSNGLSRLEVTHLYSASRESLNTKIGRLSLNVTCWALVLKFSKLKKKNSSRIFPMKSAASMCSTCCGSGWVGRLWCVVCWCCCCSCTPIVTILCLFKILIQDDILNHVILSGSCAPVVVVPCFTISWFLFTFTDIQLSFDFQCQWYFS